MRFNLSSRILMPAIATELVRVQSLITLVSVGLLMAIGCREPEPPTPPPDDEYTEALVSKSLERWDSDDWSNNQIVELIKTFSQYDNFAREISASTEIKVYEGLPHQTWESDLLKSELANNETIKFGNFPFYADPIALSDRDANRLRDLYCRRGSFVPFQGYKSCGGYHPDWCVVWTNDDVSYEVEFCFGCCEMQTTDGSSFLHCDMAKKKKFEAILSKYRTKRPKP